MFRMVIVTSMLICAGCEHFGDGKADEVDKYRFAAASWVGSNIMEMVEAWPHPMPHCGSKKGGAAGCVWWRHRDLGSSFAYDCETVAYYDEAGVITTVDVKRSRDCYRLFEAHFDRMTWPW